MSRALYLVFPFHILPPPEPQRRFSKACVILLYLALSSRPVACLECKPYIPVNDCAVASPLKPLVLVITSALFNPSEQDGEMKEYSGLGGDSRIPAGRGEDWERGISATLLGRCSTQLSPFDKLINLML